MKKIQETQIDRYRDTKMNHEDKILKHTAGKSIFQKRKSTKTQKYRY